jgi:hypothetical protein
MEENHVEKCKYLENTEENCEMIWKKWKKGKSKSYNICTIWNKGKLKSEQI